MLANHIPETRVGEIVRHTETSCDVAECFNPSSNTCPIIAVCRLKPILYRARKAFFDVLDAVTIGDIARNPGGTQSDLRSVTSGPMTKLCACNCLVALLTMSAANSNGADRPTASKPLRASSKATMTT